MVEKSADVVVVGAGVIGAMHAHRLAARGHRVTVVEKREPCRGTTGATFAWTSAHKKNPLFYHLFSLKAIPRYKALEEELGVDFWWRPTVSIYPVMDEKIYEDIYAATEAKRKEGYHLSWVDGAEARRLAPVLSPEALGASLCEEEGVLDPFRLVYFALDAARRRGAQLRWGEEVVEIQKSGNRVAAVKTNKGTIPCGSVVVSAGIHSPEVGRLAGAPIPFLRIKGEVLLTEKFPPLLPCICGSVRQTFTGNFQIGVTEIPERLDTATTVESLSTMAKKACRAFPILRRARVVRTWAGIRPMPADRVSVIGPTERCGGLLWATTHSGITLGALIAEINADFIEGKRHPDWDARFSADRFAAAAP